MYDFMEVVSRAFAIALGLVEFYSITDPSKDLGSVREALSNERPYREALKGDLNNGEISRTRIDVAVAWLRKASNALARAKMDEQGTVIRLTIDGRSPDLLRKLKTGLRLTFPRELVAKMQRAQLRGLSATAEFGGDSWIDLEVISPEQKLKSAKITLPTVTTRVGRVSSAASLQVRDVVGTRPIINRSPIGDWMLRALRDHHGDSVKRLDLDFHLAFVLG
jgi:hypothetical protein